MAPCHPHDFLPDIRDGLTHHERIVLQCLYALQQERAGRNVPTGMLYGSMRSRGVEREHIASQ